MRMCCLCGYALSNLSSTNLTRAPDAWEEAETPQAHLSCGFAEGDPESKGYARGRVLGKGGFGNVVSVKRLTTGVEFACKTVEKRLDVPHLSSAKQEQHLNNIKREVAILSRLRAALNVVHLEEVFEDKQNVYIVMQQCTGGQLLAGVGKRHYSERTVASYMRAVLRTLSQCHHHKILHRDIKPGNFMLLHEAEDSPVLAIDFGLAVFFDPKHLPVRDLGLEGTPHYIAPECLVSEVYPASDVWAAGVMAYQLLSARFPFDDWRNPRSPALSQLWKSILTEEPKLHGSSWDDVSDGAKDFIRKLLNKDPLQRITAQQALEHPWIQGRKVQRKEGKPLAGTIVQRLQRFGTESPFKRTVLDMIANDLLQRHFANMRQKQQQQQPQSQARPSLEALEGSLRRRNSSYGSLASQGNLRVLAAAFRERSTRSGNQSGMNPDKPHTVHASNEAGALLKPQQISNLQRAVPDFRHTSVGHHLNSLGAPVGSPDGDGSIHKTGDFKPSSDDPNAVQDHHNKWYKLIDDMQEQRMRQQKIQRLMLDTSGRGQANFYKTQPDKESTSKAPIEPIKEGAPAGEAAGTAKDADTSKPSKDKDNQSLARRSIFAEFEEQQAQAQRGQETNQGWAPPPEEEGRRGRGAFAALFGKAAAPFTNLSKRDTSGGPAKSQQHNVMPSICTVKGAHQRPQAPTPTQQMQQQQPQETQQQQQQQQEGDVPMQTGAWPRHPLLAAGMLGETKASPDSITSSPPALGAGAAAPAGPEAPKQEAPKQEARSNDIAAQLARLRGSDEPSGDSVRAGQQHAEGRQEGTVSKGALFTVMGKLMGGETQLKELQEALKGMQYGADRDKVSFSQVSEGLQKLGYKLQPHELEVLLREVSVGGDNLSQSAFLASQADWREFQRNHREEWLECLRNAFQGLDKNKDGRICGEEVLGALRDKLPEEEVNLAVQETLMDAAVMTEEGMDFNDFQALFQSDSMADLGAYESGLSNNSTHGGTAHGGTSMSMSRQGSEQDPLPSMSPDSSGHYHPMLERLSERE